MSGQPMVPCPKCYGSGKQWTGEEFEGACERCAGSAEVPEVEVLRERVTRLEAQVARLSPFATLVSDLDRCPHGRHERDVCGGTTGCNGPSKGNPILPTGTTVGYTMNGRPIVMPEPRQRHDAEAWMPDGYR